MHRQCEKHFRKPLATKANQKYSDSSPLSPDLPSKQSRTPSSMGILESRIEKQMSKCNVQIDRGLQFTYIKPLFNKLSILQEQNSKTQLQCFDCQTKLSNLASECAGKCKQIFNTTCLVSYKDLQYCKGCLYHAKSQNKEACFTCLRNNIDLRLCGYGDCDLHYDDHCIAAFRGDDCYGYHETFYCPKHYCVTCFALRRKHSKENKKTNLLSCVMCPNTYHESYYCLPAGTYLLSTEHIICHDHLNSSKTNTSFCFICSGGGELLCCDTCTSSFHMKCVNLDSEPLQSQIWQCSDCISGIRPMYGDIVWVKHGSFPWWPAEICVPNQIPPQIANSQHKRGEFIVQFFSDGNEYAWANQATVFKFNVGDDMNERFGKSNLDKFYIEAIVMAKIASASWNEWRNDIDLNYFSESTTQHYRKIQCNICLVNNTKLTKDEISNLSRCDCTSEELCSTDKCLTRSLMYECHHSSCPNGKNCNNRRFTRRIYPNQEYFRTCKNTGIGLRILEDIKKGDFINEYVGEIINDEEMNKRLKHLYIIDDKNFYFFNLGKNRIIDAKYKGNLSRFMNHSCCPNVTTQLWNVYGEYRVGFFALEDIPANTELTFNYNLKCIGSERLACHCGAKKCSGFLGQPYKQPTNVGEKEEKYKICICCKKPSITAQCVCYICGDRYHYKCVKFKCKKKKELWLCPRHFCNVCEAQAMFPCSMCTTSFCMDHFKGRLVKSSDTRLFCDQHIDLMVELVSLSSKRRCSFSAAEIKDSIH